MDFKRKTRKTSLKVPICDKFSHLSLPYEESVDEPQEQEGHSNNKRSVSKPLLSTQFPQTEQGDGKGVASGVHA